MDDRFQLDEIRVHRICTYKSKDQRSILKISELQSLAVGDRPMPDHPGMMQFMAISAERDVKPFKKLGIWHEVSISSVVANEMFEENTNLEVGNDASWTPEILSKCEAAQAMYLPALTMLKQMDGVGYHNDHGYPEESPKVGELKQPSVPMQHFW